MQLNRLGRFKDKKRGVLPTPPKQTVVEPPAANGVHGKFANYKLSKWFEVDGVPHENDGNYYRVRFIA